MEIERGLPLPLFEVLAALQEGGGRARVLELAERLMTNKSSLSRQLDRLEEDGFVRRERALDEDGRAVVVVLTREGRALHRSASTTYNRVAHRTFGAYLTETDLIAVQRVVGKVLDGD
jgi:DNA-binding MarR family transcriptional regulator